MNNSSLALPVIFSPRVAIRLSRCPSSASFLVTTGPVVLHKHAQEGKGQPPFQAWGLGLHQIRNAYSSPCHQPNTSQFRPHYIKTEVSGVPHALLKPVFSLNFKGDSSQPTEACVMVTDSMAFGAWQHFYLKQLQGLPAMSRPSLLGWSGAGGRTA